MEGYIGEVRLIAYNWAPQGWLFCNGQMLPINNNQALFSLITNIYGGDGRTTFALPNLMSRVVIHQGQGTGLSQYSLAATGGVEGVTLQSSQIPPHNHPYTMQVDNIQGQTTDPTNGHLAQVYNSLANQSYESFTSGNMNNPANLATQNTGANAGGGAHPNIQPYLVLNYIICVQGLYPSRP